VRRLPSYAHLGRTASDAERLRARYGLAFRPPSVTMVGFRGGDEAIPCSLDG